MPIIVKEPETEGEMLGRAYVWWRSWDESYRGIVSDEHLSSRHLPDYERRSLVETEGVIVAKDGERVVGFAKVGPCHDGDMLGAGEVFQLYVLADWQGRGVGSALMGEALRRLAGEGFVNVVLWVLEENGRAISFYAKHGFVADGQTQAMPRLGDGVTAMRMARRLGPRPSEGATAI